VNTFIVYVNSLLNAASISISEHFASEFIIVASFLLPVDHTTFVVTNEEAMHFIFKNCFYPYIEFAFIYPISIPNAVSLTVFFCACP